MKITENIRPCRLLSWHDLTDKEKQEFDWLETEDDQYSASFFRSKGQVYCLGEFLFPESAGIFSEWDGVYCESAFSAVLVKIIHSFDTEVIVGRYYS